MTIAQLHRSTAHPPCPPQLDVVEVTVPADRSHLSIRDRLSLRIGLWLITRTAVTTSNVPTQDTVRAAFAPRANHTEREALTLLAYHLQRQLH